MRSRNGQGLRVGRWSARAATPLVALALVVGGVAQTPAAHAAAVANTGALKEQAALAAFSHAHFGIPNTTSPNWSGYSDTNYSKTGNFRSVKASWNVPEMADNDCQNGTFATGEGLSGFWVGIDGNGDKTVEQTGTADECYQGTPYYWDWYEMYPNPIVVVAAVSAGDHITASVTKTSAGYVLAINDTTSGTSNNVTESCPAKSTCSNHSAEVIAEAPGGCVTAPGQTCRGKLYPMPNYQWVQFHNISVATKSASGGIGASKFGPQNITMQNSLKIALAVDTSTIAKNAFTNSWEASG